MSPILVLHIASGTLGVLSGFVAVFLLKGSHRHGIAGKYLSWPSALPLAAGEGRERAAMERAGGLGDVSLSALEIKKARRMVITLSLGHQHPGISPCFLSKTGVNTKTFNGLAEALVSCP